MIRAVTGLITTDFYKEEKYILSNKEDSISLPHWEINDYKDLSNQIKSHIVNDVFTDKTMANGYINLKFLSINDQYISQIFSDSNENLYFLYGCICPKISINQDFFWKKFDIYDTEIRLELNIINDIISKTI